MSVSKRLRFEIFKRDSFTCRYCGNKSPKVILELDHIIPKSKKGRDDEMNLLTSCFDCNRGKSDRNLSEIITGEDPHDKAIEILERERQMAEYNEVMNEVYERVGGESKTLIERFSINAGNWTGAITNALVENSFFDVQDAIDITKRKKGIKWDTVPYFWGVLNHITGKKEFDKKEESNG